MAAVAAVQAYAVGYVLHSLHGDPAEAHEVAYIDPTLHWLRDSSLALPAAFCFLLAATLALRWLLGRVGCDPDGFRARVGWAVAGAFAYALASIPGAVIHNELFLAGHDDVSFVTHSLEEALITARYSFVILILFSALWGVPWRRGGRAAGADSGPIVRGGLGADST